MGSTRATTLAQGFSQKLLLEMYDQDLKPYFTNRDYEGEINGVGSVLNILNFSRIAEKTYTGSNLTVDQLLENNTQLVISQYKSFYWQEKTLDNWLSYIKDPHPTIVAQKAEERLKNIETYLLGFYAKVAAGNRVGTDKTSGTVAVDASGNVTGSGTNFASTDVGRGFKATGHTKWYRVKSYASATSIVIEDDLDDVTSQYTGGVINSGATFIIEASTPLAITTSTLLQQVAALKFKLDIAERFGKSSVPDSDRSLFIPAEAESVIVRASGVLLNVPEAYTELVKNGFMTMLQGFAVFKTNRLTGDNTNGWRVLAIQKNWMTYAEKLLQADIEEEIIGNFGTAYKDLFVYGAKVPDTRRHFAAEGYWTF